MRATGKPSKRQRGRNGVHAGLQPGLGLARPDRDIRGTAHSDPVRAARRPQDEGPVGSADRSRRGHGGGDDRLRHAGRPDRALRAGGRNLRPVPDHVDRRRGDLGLQHDGRDRALRRPAPIVRRDLGGPAHPGRDRRVLLRRAAGGARRLRHAGRDHRGDDDRARLPPDQGGGDRARGEHGARGVRRDSHPDHHAVGDHRARQGRPRRHGRSPDTVPRPDRPADPDRHGRRASRHQAGVARGGRRWPQLRPRPVRLLELHLGRADRHRRGAAQHRRDRGVPARVDPRRAAARRGHRAKRAASSVPPRPAPRYTTR